MFNLASLANLSGIAAQFAPTNALAVVSIASDLVTHGTHVALAQQQINAVVQDAVKSGRDLTDDDMRRINDKVANIVNHCHATLTAGHVQFTPESDRPVPLVPGSVQPIPVQASPEAGKALLQGLLAAAKAG